MALSNDLTQQAVNDAIDELKACIEDIKQGGTFQHLEEHLPRLAHILRHNRVLVQALNDLPKADFESLIAKVEERSLRNYTLALFSAEPKARLSEQIAILVAIGDGQLNLWDFADKLYFNGPAGFWEDLFFPATRDLLRYAISVQKTFAEQIRVSVKPRSQKMSTSKKYSLDLFVSHSSKDADTAKALIEFLRAALAIPHDKVRCTSVDGYKLAAGTTTESELKREIHESRCFVGIITPQSLQSHFVLFELGARWGSHEHMVPLLAGGIRASDLRPPLSNLNALCCSEEEEMHQLVHDLAKLLNRKVPPPAAYKSQLNGLLKSARAGLFSKAGIPSEFLLP